MSEQNCLFCQIVKQKIPCYKVYEDDLFLAFLDINPCQNGHTVLIPKRHIETNLDLNQQEQNTLIPVINKIIKKIDEKLKPAGYNIGWNFQAAGGQVVPHYHIHIIPRWLNDGGGSMHSIIKATDLKNIEEIAKLLFF